MASGGTRKRVRELLNEIDPLKEGIQVKHLKIYFESKTEKSEKSVKEQKQEFKTELKNEPEVNLIKHSSSCSTCSQNKKQIDLLNKKFDSMIHLQSKLISLLEDIDYRFNDKGQMLSYIS